MASELWVDYAYWLEIKPARARKMKWNRLKGSMPVDLEEFPAFENPRALVESYDRNISAPSYGYGGRRPVAPQSRRKTWTKGNRSIGPCEIPGKETVTTWCAGHAGRLWRPLTSPGVDEFCSLDQLRNGAHSPNWFDHPFLSRKDREKFDDLKRRDEVLNHTVRETGTDTEERVMAAMANIAAGIAVVDGKVWRVQADPVWVVGRSEKAVTLNLLRPSFKEEHVGVAFRADRLDEAEAFAESLRASLGDATGASYSLSRGHRRIGEVDPAFLQPAVDGAAARLMGYGVRKLAEAHKLGDAETVAGEILEALDSRLHGVEIGRLVGDPYRFADQVSAWADDVRSLRDTSFGSTKRFARSLDEIAQPFAFARGYGIKPAAVSDEGMMSVEDMDFLASLGDDFGPGPSDEGPAPRMG